MYRWGPLTCTHLHPATTRQQMKYHTVKYNNLKLPCILISKTCRSQTFANICHNMYDGYLYTGGEGVQWEFDGFIRLDWIGQCTKHVQSTNGLLM